MSHAPIPDVALPLELTQDVALFFDFALTQMFNAGSRLLMFGALGETRAYAYREGQRWIFLGKCPFSLGEISAYVRVLGAIPADGVQGFAAVLGGGSGYGLRMTIDGEGTSRPTVLVAVTNGNAQQRSRAVRLTGAARPPTRVLGRVLVVAAIGALFCLLVHGC